MRELLLDRLIYIIDNPLLTLVISFISGFLATRIVCPNRRFGWLGAFIVGLIGFFLSYFVVSYLPLDEYLESLAGLRVIVDFLATFAGSFVIAGIIHFIKPS